VAAWAVALGVFLILVASATSRGATGGAQLDPDFPTGGSEGQSAPSAPAAQRGEARSATWYGPGFYGRRTACGILLRHSTQGVAHRRLPCGTRVTFTFGGHSRTVPVIDRGPFARGVDWDLTQATARALGLDRTASVRASWKIDAPHGGAVSG
jgi:rare lipoprotein A (peptidoglycan hydrolase)